MLAIIQARSNSKRFKNKVLSKIFDKTLIEHVIENVKKSKKVKKIIVATSTSKFDKKLIKFLNLRKINIFKGNLENVALRLLNTALKNKSQFFLRISADSPLIDYRLINKAILLLKKNQNTDLITNIFPRSFPQGQSIEIIKTGILKKNIKFMTMDEREHVTKYFYKNHSNFKIKNFKCSKNYKFKSIKKMTVDYKSDLIRIKKIINEN